jgi:hypothetical protein
MHLSGSKVEPGCVKRALNPAVLHVAIGQEGILMSAGVINSEYFAIFRVDDGDGWSCVEP